MVSRFVGRDEIQGPWVRRRVAQGPRNRRRPQAGRDQMVGVVGLGSRGQREAQRPPQSSLTRVVSKLQPAPSWVARGGARQAGARHAPPRCSRRSLRLLAPAAGSIQACHCSGSRSWLVEPSSMDSMKSSSWIEGSWHNSRKGGAACVCLGECQRVSVGERACRSRRLACSAAHCPRPAMHGRRRRCSSSRPAPAPPPKAPWAATAASTAAAPGSCCPSWSCRRSSRPPGCPTCCRRPWTAGQARGVGGG